MDKFYYTSSDGTARDLNGELCHGIGDWFKKDAKYIKREWKNGKWVYTYPDDKKNAASNKKDRSKKSGSTVMDELSKWFGVDARKTRDDAERKLKQDTYTSKRITKEYKKARDDAAYDKYITGAEYLNVKMKEVAKRSAENKMTNSGEAYAKASDEFAKTPLGKLEKTSAAIKKYVDNLTDKKDLVTLFKEARKYAEEKNKSERLAERERERQEAYDVAVEETVKANKLKGSFNAIIDALKRYNPLPKLLVKEHPYTPAQDMALVNPNYGRDSDYDENCAICTVAYDLRRRGYDVEVLSERATANDGSNTVGMRFKEIVALYKNVPEENVKKMDGYDNLGQAVINKNKISDVDMRKSLSTLEAELLKYGDGARGNFCVYWRQGGGHSVVWEIEDGEVVIRDAQTNRVHRLDDYVSDIYYFESVRTDNVEPSDEVMKYVKNRERSK